MNSKSSPVRSRREILNLLKTEGPRDSSSLGRRLGISAMAVRQHLYALQSQKFVTYHEEARPVGRPAKIWALKPAADLFFPDAHSELAASMLGAVRESFGEEGLERVLSVISRHQVDTIRKRLSLIEPLKDRLKALATLLSRQGHLMKFQELPDGSFLLVGNHCPIRAAARACPGLCEHELEAFRRIIGTQHRVERTECINAGARRCLCRIHP